MTSAHFDTLGTTVEHVSIHIRLTPDLDDGGYVAEVLERPGCMSQGETKPEATRNVLAALLEILEGEAP